MDSIKLSIFLPPQIIFYISTVTIYLPYQILILFEIYTETLGASALSSYDSPRRSSPLPHSLRPPLFYIIERVKYNKMDFYLIISHFNSSFVFVSPPPVPSDPDHGIVWSHLVRRGGGANTTCIIQAGDMRVEGVFFPYLPARKVPSFLPNLFDCCCCHRRGVNGGGCGNF